MNISHWTIITMKYLFCIALVVSAVSCVLCVEQRIGNPDDTAKIERPCPTYDLNCIRAFFANHAHCKKTFGPVPDPIIRPQSNQYTPVANISISRLEQRITGLNGIVEEFYINRETDNLVLTVEFRNVNLSSDNLVFKFHRRAKEPVTTRTFYSVLFNSVAVTAVVPNIKNLQLQEAECTAFVDDGTPPFILGPSAVGSTDPQPALAITMAVALIPASVQEEFLTDAPYLIGTFIQYSICDFGLQLS